jgi:uncharacterized C2H2 Zn-finger protein
MSFVNTEELAKNIALVHTANGDKMFQCQSCNMFFSNKEDFEDHAVKLHSNTESN